MDSFGQRRHIGVHLIFWKVDSGDFAMKIVQKPAQRNIRDHLALLWGRQLYHVVF